MLMCTFCSRERADGRDARDLNPSSGKGGLDASAAEEARSRTEHGASAGGSILSAAVVSDTSSGNAQLSFGAEPSSGSSAFAEQYMNELLTCILETSAPDRTDPPPMSLAFALQALAQLLSARPDMIQLFIGSVAEAAREHPSKSRLRQAACSVSSRLLSLMQRFCAFAVCGVSASGSVSGMTVSPPSVALSDHQLGAWLPAALTVLHRLLDSPYLLAAGYPFEGTPSACIDAVLALLRLRPPHVTSMVRFSSYASLSYAFNPFSIRPPLLLLRHEGCA